ncbi:MAG: hypothetical protein NVS9B4_15230 [Candidatus Acidiferrum sp.]
MRSLNRGIGLLLLAAAIVAPAIVVNAAQPQELRRERIYDRYHHDYHEWDDREDRAYRRYLAERHKHYLEYKRQQRRDQLNYWRWRHHHPDLD